MSLAVGDIVKITDFQVSIDQDAENVYFYRIDAIPTPASGLTVDEEVCGAFNADVRIFMLPFQSDQCSHRVTRMDNVTNGVDFATVSSTVFGLLSGDPEPSFVAANFVLRRSTLITRNGSKRVAGLSEGSVNGNNWVGSSGDLAAYATALAAPLMDNTLPTPVPFATPVIVGRKIVGTGSHGAIYGLDLTKINPIASAAFTAVSTQRSRKVGHGH